MVWVGSVDLAAAGTVQAPFLGVERCGLLTEEREWGERRIGEESERRVGGQRQLS